MRLASLLAALALPAGALAFKSPQVPLAAKAIPQFVDPLPLLSVQPGGTMSTVVATGTSFAAPLPITMCEFQANILPTGTFAPNVKPATWVWGYVAGTTCPTAPQDTYIGPVLVNVKDVPTTIRFRNALPTVDRTNVLAYKYSTDQTLHWADPLGGEMNMCQMASGDPPQVNVGIPAFHSQCSLNFGEWFDPVLNQGGFNPVGIPAVPHLHGGEVPPVLDGGPDAWFSSDGAMKGHDYYSYSNLLTGVVPAGNEAIYRYPNSQNAAPLWFHDHTLGATRLNVYAGIAGAYYLLDPAQEAYFAPKSPTNPNGINMRPVTEVVPIVLQDRMFDTNGQLFFPTDFPGGINGPSPNPQHPYWNPEFIGDTIVVNGKAWPFLNVEPRRYRFLFLNGSNARTYELFLKNVKSGQVGPPLWVIGNDGGFLDTPALVDPNSKVLPRLVIMPGERYEVIIDFTKAAGQTLFLRNVAKAPYPGGATPQGTTTGQILQFRVSATAVADATYDPASGIPLRPTPIVRLTNPATGTVAPGVTIAKTRELTLNEVALLAQTATDPVTGVANTLYPGGPVEILVNNTKWAGKNRSDFQAVTVGGITEYVSETPAEGSIELWEIVNTTMDAHPIHTHLATFQILNRQNYDAKGFFAAYSLGFQTSLPAGCTAGVYCPAYGPPYDYDPALNALSGGKLGGNPDVTPFLQGPIRLPDADEVGWKDTFLVLPGMVNRILVRFAPTDTAANAVAAYPFSPNDGTNGAVGDSHGYVWHCHIIDHEDNEMMRPDVIVPLAGASRTIVKGTDY
ncbi:MAG TPA: multicopper oxidase domain-containing protein [Anaeromyxobacter sp.]